MRNIYNLIWVDAILSFKKHNPKKSEWRIIVFVMITWMNGLNWWVVFMIIKYFNLFRIPIIELNVFPGQAVNDFLSFTTEFALPFGILNYFLIFYNKRYEVLIEKYGPQKTRYAFNYVLISALGAFIFAVLYGILTHTII